GYSFQFYTSCSDPTFAFSGTVFPGTYRVSVQGIDTVDSNLPAPNYIALPTLDLPSSYTGLVLDVKTISVGGTVTLNGAAPVFVSYCKANPSSTSSFPTRRSSDLGYSFQFYTSCSDPTFAFSGTVFPGTYRVSVQGIDTVDSNL